MTTECGNCGGRSPDCWVCNPEILGDQYERVVWKYTNKRDSTDEQRTPSSLDSEERE